MHLLLLFVLLLHIHSISSTSLLSIKKLTREEVMVHTNGANMTNLATTKLSGYYTRIFYDDKTCSTPVRAFSIALDTCYGHKLGDYAKMTATPSHVFSTSYSDSLCTIPTRDGYNISYVDGVCDPSDRFDPNTSKRIFVSSSSAWNSDVATATRTWANARSVMIFYSIL